MSTSSNLTWRVLVDDCISFAKQLVKEMQHIIFYAHKGVENNMLRCSRPPGRGRALPIEMLFQVFRLNFSWKMPKMHYFSNKCSKIAKRWMLSAPSAPNLRFWWPEVSWCGQILFFQADYVTKSKNFKKSVMTLF